MEHADLFEGKYKRLLQAVSAKNDADLANALRISQASVSSAKKRRQIPTGWVEFIAESYGVCADWLFFGRGPTYPKEESPPCPPVPMPCPPFSCSRCERLETRLETMERELHEINAEIRQLWKENSMLREENAILRERAPKVGQGGSAY